MTARTLALDVGGVLYYDEPFALAWLQDVWDSARADDPALTMGAFQQAVRDFYRNRQQGAPSPSLYPPKGTRSWRSVRERWSTLVQPIPGAVHAVARLAENHELCIIANQPPECRAALRDLGVEQHVRLVALDCLVGYAKPDPRLFQWALDHLGWRPEHTMIVGDRPDHDAAPARELGCSAAIVEVDDGWSVPDGVAPEIVTAYRQARAQRGPAAEAHMGRRVTSLAQLARTLRDTDRDKHSPAPSREVRP